MSGALLIIVLGAPGAGKTTLARQLAAELDLPLLVRDDFKEILFDTLGWSDRPWSRKLGLASARLLYYALETFLAAGHSLVVESNFRNEYDAEHFAALQRRHGCRTVQVLCEAEPKVLLQRFRGRAGSGERHPGHVDHVLVADFAQVCRGGCWEALAIDGPVIRVDMNDLEAIDTAGIAGTIRALAEGGRGQGARDKE